MASKNEDKPSRGRSTDLTPAVQAKIIEALRAGNTQKAAAAYAGIAISTFHDWLQRGRGTHPERSQEPWHVAFVDAVEKAEADAEVAHVALIKKAAMGGNWTASAWWLERRRPEDYGRRQKVTFDDPSLTADEIAEARKAATPDEVAQLRAMMSDPAGQERMLRDIIRRARLEG